MITSKLRKGLILSTLPHQCSFSEDVRAGAQTWQGIGVDTGAMEACSLPPCSSNLPVCFLMEVAPFGLGPPCQSLIKKIPYKPTYSLILWKHFLNWAFSDDSGLCQVDIKVVNRTSPGVSHWLRRTYEGSQERDAFVSRDRPSCMTYRLGTMPSHVWGSHGNEGSF